MKNYICQQVCFSTRMKFTLHMDIIEFDPLSGSPFYKDGTMDAPLSFVPGMFIDEYSQIYIAEEYNHCIRKIDENGTITIIAGTGQSGYSGDVPFDFQEYPHIGPKKKKPSSNKPTK